jgi:hypothetical protein
VAPPPRSARKSPKPTQPPVESESDEEPTAEEPRLRGALRGLDMGNMLAPPDRRHSLGASDDGRQSTPTDTPQHETRASRHGKTPVNYSAKWHPMDEVMHPKRARRLAGGSTSRRRAVDDSGDSDPEPFSGGGTDDEDDADEMPETPFEREPDAGATRRSARSEARKPVNYSKAHHPQDHLLPGYRNRAKRQRRSTSTTQPRKRKTSNETIALSSQTLAHSDSDGDDESDDDDTQLQAADPATDTASSPREQQEEQSAQKKRTMPTDVADDSHHILKAVPGLSRGESSFNYPDAIVRGLLHQVEQPGLDSQFSSQNVDRNRSDDDMADRSTQALISGVTAFMPGAEDPAAISSDQVAGKHAQESPVPENRSGLHTSHHATVTTNLLTPSSAMDKYTQAGSWSLKIVRPYSTPQVEPSTKCQPSPSQQSKGAEVPKPDDLPNNGDCEDEPVERQGQDDALNSQDDLSRTERRGSSDVASHHHVASTGDIMRGFSDLSSRAGLASHDLGDCMTAMGPASRQASRDTQPDDLLGGESYFNAAMSTSQSPSRATHEDKVPHAYTVADLPDSVQNRVEGNAAGLQLASDEQALATDGEGLSQPTANGPQEGFKPEEDRLSGSAGVSKGMQSPPASFIPAASRKGSIPSSSTQSEDSILLAGSGA